MVRPTLFFMFSIILNVCQLETTWVAISAALPSPHLSHAPDTQDLQLPNAIRPELKAYCYGFGGLTTEAISTKTELRWQEN